MVQRPRLGQLIERDHGKDDNDDQQPPASRPGSGRHWLGVAQRRESPPLLHATQRGAWGRAFNLARGISLPEALAWADRTRSSSRSIERLPPSPPSSPNSLSPGSISAARASASSFRASACFRWLARASSSN